MKIVFVVLVLLYVIILSFPIVVRVKLENNDIFIHVLGIKVLKQNIYEAGKETYEITRDSFLSELIKFDDIIYARLLKKVKIKRIDLTLSDFKDEFHSRAVILSQLGWILAFLRRYCQQRQIPFNYMISYDSKPVYFHGIFVLQVGKILLEYFRLRRIRHARTSNTSVARYFTRQSHPND